MNKDFHYYGTYYAARFAGYSRADAEEIAWAAQMVDDFTESEFGHHFPNRDAIFTSQTLGEMASICSYEDVTDEIFQHLRRVWAVFHFLPGNYSNSSLQMNDGFDFGKYNFSYERELRDFKCICTPNSELVKFLVESVRVNCTSNIRVGILMHVIADTWAHQGFCGSPNRNINNIENLSGQSRNLIHSYDIGKDYMNLYLGHARLDHLPDYGFAQYTYKPSWSKDSIAVDNVQRFFDAFCQMVEALQYINGYYNPFSDFELKGYYRENEQDNIPTVVRNHRHLIGRIFESGGTDQSTTWVSEMSNIDDLGSPEPYNKNRYGDNAFNEFEQEAVIHLDKVMNFVDARVKGYFRDNNP